MWLETSCVPSCRALAAVHGLTRQPSWDYTLSHVTRRRSIIDQSSNTIRDRKGLTLKPLSFVTHGDLTLDMFASIGLRPEDEILGAMSLRYRLDEYGQGGALECMAINGNHVWCCALPRIASVAKYCLEFDSANI